MKKIDLDYLSIGDDKFPVYCDMNVMAQIQDKYESITEFERKLMGWKVARDDDGEPIRNTDGTLKKTRIDPSVSTIIDTLFWFISEGQAVEKIQGAADGSRTEPITLEELKMATFSSRDIITLAFMLHAVFMRCFTVKKNQDDNRTETQPDHRIRKKSTS